MYCLKCRRVTETANTTTATSQNGRLIMHGQCVICGKLRLRSLKMMLLGEVFLLLW